MESSWESAYKKKLIYPEDIEKTVSDLKEQGKKVVTLNGSFDLLHAGHLHIIYEASMQGDCLILALNSDSSIKKYKSPLRPIIQLENRLQMVAALEFVDYVTWFEETDPRELLKIIKPDVHVNGAEYGSECIESGVVMENGGKIHIANLKPSLSTSHLIEKIAKICT